MRKLKKKVFNNDDVEHLAIGIYFSDCIVLFNRMWQR